MLSDNQLYQEMAVSLSFLFCEFDTEEANRMSEDSQKSDLDAFALFRYRLNAPIRFSMRSFHNIMADRD